MPNIIIQGYGMVGSTLHYCLQELGFTDIAIHDPYKGLIVSPESDTADRANVLFYCVNEKDGLVGDGSLIEKMEGGLIIIKTTLAIGETEQLQSMYPRMKFVYMPEFLSENTAKEDMMNPDFLIYGSVDPEYSALANNLFVSLNVPHHFLEPKEAELAKLVSNVYPIIKIVFFNYIYELCQAYEIDYDRLIVPQYQSKYNGGYYMNIWDKGGRGGGGKCFPKDLKILLVANSNALLREVQRLNNYFLNAFPKKKGVPNAQN